jgi:ABC-type sugar transport system ATPase subunit
VIEVRDLLVHAGSFTLGPLTFCVSKGEHVAIMGRTGHGKTTLLETLCGLRTASSGTIHLGGQNVTHQPPKERGIGYVPQDLALFTTRTVRGNLEFALKLKGWAKSERNKRVEELAEWLGIRPLLDRRVTTLSGGEAQRTAIGRALSFAPQVLLLDEPMSALDEQTRQELHAVIKQVRQTTEVTILHITHLMSEATTLADRVIQLQFGSIVTP